MPWKRGLCIVGHSVSMGAKLPSSLRMGSLFHWQTTKQGDCKTSMACVPPAWWSGPIIPPPTIATSFPWWCKVFWQHASSPAMVSKVIQVISSHTTSESKTCRQICSTFMCWISGGTMSACIKEKSTSNNSPCQPAGHQWSHVTNHLSTLTDHRHLQS